MYTMYILYTICVVVLYAGIVLFSLDIYDYRFFPATRDPV